MGFPYWEAASFGLSLLGASSAKRRRRRLLNQGPTPYVPTPAERSAYFDDINSQLNRVYNRAYRDWANTMSSRFGDLNASNIAGDIYAQSGNLLSKYRADALRDFYNRMYERGYNTWLTKLGQTPPPDYSGFGAAAAALGQALARMKSAQAAAPAAPAPIPGPSAPAPSRFNVPGIGLPYATYTRPSLMNPNPARPYGLFGRGFQEPVLRPRGW